MTSEFGIIVIFLAVAVIGVLSRIAWELTHGHSTGEAYEDIAREADDRNPPVP